MSTKKAAASKPNAPVLPVPLKRLIELLRGPGGHTLLLLAVAVGVFVGLSVAAWRKVGKDVLGSQQYWLSPENVEITPPPPWIHRDIRGQVFRDASLDGPLSIMDDDLAERLAKAFALDPWVAKVRRVTKRYPARVHVELEYRRPVLMVQVPGGLLAVDADGVLLPSEASDFSPIEALAYPRLVGANTIPVGPVGTHWGDPRVLEAAEIAAVLAETWETLDLDRIVPSKLVELGYGDQFAYELVTKGGTRIQWGRAPSAEIPGEPTAAEKLAWLRQYHREHGTLDGPHGQQELDLRRLAKSPATRQTARIAGGELDGSADQDGVATFRADGAASR